MRAILATGTFVYQSTSESCLAVTSEVAIESLWSPYDIRLVNGKQVFLFLLANTAVVTTAFGRVERKPKKKKCRNRERNA